MLTPSESAALAAAWEPARAAGVLGSASLSDLWEHTAGFVSAVCSSFSGRAEQLNLRVVDVGTGAGVPGLLLAHQLPRSHVTLLDASERRLDHVRRARRALELLDRTTIAHGRAEDVGRFPDFRGAFDVAVARLLGDPRDTLELLVPFVRSGGLLVVSTTEAAADVWVQLPVEGLPLGPAVVQGTSDRFASIRLVGAIPDTLPRPPKARQRAPFFR
ncbi:MAG: RsmG family class I SAM-dependent methyltransferase [Actinomycetota bacterium]